VTIRFALGRYLENNTYWNNIPNCISKLWNILKLLGKLPFRAASAQELHSTAQFFVPRCLSKDKLKGQGPAQRKDNLPGNRGCSLSEKLINSKSISVTLNLALLSLTA